MSQAIGNLTGALGIAILLPRIGATLLCAIMSAVLIFSAIMILFTNREPKMQKKESQKYCIK